MSPTYKANGSARKRFEREPDRPRHIHTVRGVGYRFTREPEEPK